jgi:5'-3' exonuclease
MVERLNELKRKCIKLHTNDIIIVKQLLDACGAKYIDAPGEADELCAYMVIKNLAYACISEDMDMFIYGCPRVLRYLSLFKKTCIMYNFKSIMENLGVSPYDFKQICIISGTDYNINRIPFYNVITYYKKFIIHKRKMNNSPIFIHWFLNNNNKKYTIDSLDNINHIMQMFNVKKNLYLKPYDKISFNKTNTDDNMIKNILIKDGFIFP